MRHPVAELLFKNILCEMLSKCREEGAVSFWWSQHVWESLQIFWGSTALSAMKWRCSVFPHRVRECKYDKSM